MSFGSALRRRRFGFTLVELLVVIGIIAVLISILLPTLSRARRQAYVTQCQSNMRQVATAMMMYIQDNKYRFPPAAAPVITGVYPSGWWWPNELVRLGFIKGTTLNVYEKPGVPKTAVVFRGSSPFRCPEGQEISNTLGMSLSQNYPTDGGNLGFVLNNDSQAATAGFGVPSWYMLTSRVQTGTNSYPTGSKISPFMWFNSSSDANTLKDPKYQRSQGLVRKASEVVMIVEASNSNWDDQTQTSPGIYLGRLAGRHGKVTRDGKNAWTNFAFFDGHVGIFETLPFTRQTSTGGNDNALIDYYKDTIFYLSKQRK